MADENKQADNDEKFNAAFQEMLKRNGLEHPEEHEKKAREYFREHGNLDDFTIVLDKQEETSAINHTEEGRQDQAENEPSQLENEQLIKDAWKKYCEDNNLLEPAFKDEGVDFTLYKDEAAKQKDDYIAKMKYESNGLNVKTQKGKLPDFTFFQQTAKVEKDRGMKNLKVESENPEFKALMLAAALEAGLSIGKEQIDLNLAAVKKLPQELQDKITKHNESIETQNTAPENTPVNPHAKTQELRDKIEKIRQLKNEKKYKEADELLTPEQVAEQKRRGILRSKSPKVTEEIRNKNRVAGFEKRKKTASEPQQKVINDLIAKYRGNNR